MMKLSMVFTIAAVVSLIFGLADLLAPAQLNAMYGVELSPNTTFLARLFGVSLIGYGVLAWLVRNAPPSESRSAIVTAFFVSLGLGFLVSLWGQLTAEFSPLGWSTVVLYFLLAAGFAYHQFGMGDS